MHAYFGDVWLTRLLVQRGMAAVYVVAFIAVVHQFKPLLGEKGLLPAPAHLKNITFRSAPTIFHWRYSDRLLDAIAWTGLLISVCALFGLTEMGPVWVSVIAWLLLWAFYLSIVNVGQKFFAFGWESMLLEAGFFTAFLGPSRMRAFRGAGPDPALDAVSHRDGGGPDQAAPRPLLARPDLPLLSLRNPAAAQPAELVLPSHPQSAAPVFGAGQSFCAGGGAVRAVCAAADRVYCRRPDHLPPALAHHQRQLFVAELAHCGPRRQRARRSRAGIGFSYRRAAARAAASAVRHSALRGRRRHGPAEHSAHAEPAVREPGDELQLQPLPPGEYLRSLRERGPGALRNCDGGNQRTGDHGAHTSGRSTVSKPSPATRSACRRKSRRIICGSIG